MKRRLPIVGLAAALVACNQPTDDAHRPDSGSSTATAAPNAGIAQTVPPPVKTEGNPNRLHQLKDLKKTDLKVKGTTIHAWIMDDESKQEEGMMFLTDAEVKPNEGMLFAFSEVQPKSTPDGKPRGFWMHNTLIPLDIIYLTPAGKVVNVGHGKVQDDTTVAPAAPFQYVLEVKAGTAARLGLKPGDTIAIPKL